MTLTSMYSVSSRILALCGSIVILAAPIAAVSETFEYDVLRALNDPLVMNRAQRYFGQQMLTHVRTLDWGFRVGGTVINVRLIMNIVTAMAITLVTTLSQAMFSMFENVAFDT